MHFVFMPYGNRPQVEHLMREMEAQKFPFRLHKDGKEETSIWLAGSIRLLPFGVYEYVFPKESMDVVLTTLMPDKSGERYHVEWIKQKILQKMFRTEPIPKEYNKEKKLIWAKEHVNIIPIGIRHDGEITERDGSYPGWSHEAI